MAAAWLWASAVGDGRANEFGPWVGQRWGWEVGRWGLLGRSELYSIFKKLAKLLKINKFSCY